MQAAQTLWTIVSQKLGIFNRLPMLNQEAHSVSSLCLGLSITPLITEWLFTFIARI
jgi:hypothetical protein